MKYQLITLFALVSVCHGQTTETTTTKGVSDIIINNVTEPLPTIDDVTDKDNTTTTSSTTPTTSTSSSTSTTPTTTVNPNSTTTTTTTTPKTPTTKTTPTTAPTPTTSTTKPTTTNATTTVKPTPTTGPTTAKPTPTKVPVTTVAPTPASNRKFDGPSFVGGIVLASGLMAIGFVAFKFYKARTELNYHTL